MGVAAIGRPVTDIAVDVQIKMITSTNRTEQKTTVVLQPDISRGRHRTQRPSDIQQHRSRLRTDGSGTGREIQIIGGDRCPVVHCIRGDAATSRNTHIL